MGQPVALVVNDAAPVRSLLVAVLEREGLACTAAASKEAALVALAEQGARIRLAIIDVHLHEDSDGLKLARAIHALLPTVPIAMVCAEEAGLQEAARIPGVVRTLLKPANVRSVRELATLARPSP